MAGRHRRRRRRRRQVAAGVRLRRLARRARRARCGGSADGRLRPRPTLPFALLHDMFATRFGISGNDGPVEVRRKWERGLEQALGPGDETVERAHTIALWLGFEIGETATITGDPQSLSGRAASQLGEYLCRLAERAPVVLLLEDLHWADEATLGLIHAAEPVLRDSSVLVVATSRPTLLEQHPHWGEGARLPHAHLAALAVAAGDAPPARRDPEGRRPRARSARRPRRDRVRGQSVLRRGAGELVPRVRRHPPRRHGLAGASTTSSRRRSCHPPCAACCRLGSTACRRRSARRCNGPR